MPKPKTPAKPKQTPVAEPIWLIPTSAIDRHPDNRVPEPKAIAELAASLAAEGQKEPIVIRPLTGGARYQIVSGETRWRAARFLEWDTIAARIKTLDDQQALRELAVANLARRDLTPLQTAALLAKLTEPADQGGGGMSAAEAGKLFGLNSASGVKNKIGLLRLPKYWRDQVEAGAIPETAARQLLPYKGRVGEALQKMHAADLKDPWASDARESWQSRDGVADNIKKVLRQSTRPIEAGHKHNYGWQYGARPRLFELTDKTRAAVKIEKLPIGKNGKLVEVATDVDAYEKLQIPLLKSKANGSSKNGAANGKAKAGKPTAAEEKQKARERAEKLKAKAEDLRQRLLRIAIADRLAIRDQGAVDLAVILFPALVAHGRDKPWAGSCNPRPFLEQAAVEHRGEIADQARPLKADGALSYLAALDCDGDQVTGAEFAIRRAAQLILWPQVPAELARQTAARDFGDQWPEALVWIDPRDLAAFAATAGADLDRGWKLAASRKGEGDVLPAAARECFRRLVAAHHRDDLPGLAAELYGGSSDHLAKTKTKAEAVEAIVAAHNGAKPAAVIPAIWKTRKKGGAADGLSEAARWRGSRPPATRRPAARR